MPHLRNFVRWLPALAFPALARAGSNERISVDSAGREGDGNCKWSGVDDDGTLVVFDSVATNLVANDTNGAMDIFLRDRTTGATTRLSIDAAGVEGDGDSSFPAMTPDGRLVVFDSSATNLISGDLNASDDIFLRDLVAGTIERVSLGPGGVESDGHAARPGITPDGRFITFYSIASNLVANDTNAVSDIFVVDRQAGTIERISVDSTGAQADAASFAHSISDDGRFVAFSSDATNLVAGDTNGKRDVFLRDRQAGTTTRISLDWRGRQLTTGDSDSPRIAGDGSSVAYSSNANRIVQGDTTNRYDVYVRDLASGTNELVSVSTAGVPANGGSLHPRITADGLRISFESAATDLVTGDTNGKYDVFLRDRLRGTTRRLSVDDAGGEADGDTHSGWLSANGLHLTWYSDATDLVPNDTNGVTDLFLRSLCPAARWANYGSGFPGLLGVPALTLRADPMLGTTITADLGDSTGAGTLAAVLIGASSAQIPTSKGGDLLVVPFTSLLLTIPLGGTTLTDDVPDDETLCGVALYVQALELDAAAAGGVSFTAGLELVLGR